jgi:glycosyltransferase involved in cell wall biosynthesis
MRRAGVPGSRIDVIYHGLDAAFATPPDNRATGGSARPYVLAVGGVSPRKNTRRLIEAFTRWRSREVARSKYQLLITGTSLDPEFARNGGRLPDAVSLLGYVEKTRLRELYADAAVFLYPGIYEGFGLPIIEAMACGAPVVTSMSGATPEIAGGAAVLVDPFDVESMAQGLEQATLPAEAERLRSLGLERVRAFTWSAAAEQTLHVYRQLT